MYGQTGVLTSLCHDMNLIIKVPEDEDKCVALIQAIKWTPKGKGIQGSLVFHHFIDTELLDDYVLPTIRIESYTDSHGINISFIDDVVLEGEIRLEELVHFTGSRIR
jgi:hypothetical protein